jgi:hypothetical protein
MIKTNQSLTAWITKLGKSPRLLHHKRAKPQEQLLDRLE